METINVSTAASVDIAEEEEEGVVLVVISTEEEEEYFYRRSTIEYKLSTQEVDTEGFGAWPSSAINVRSSMRRIRLASSFWCSLPFDASPHPV